MIEPRHLVSSGICVSEPRLLRSVNLTFKQSVLKIEQHRELGLSLYRDKLCKYACHHQQDTIEGDLSEWGFMRFRFYLSVFPYSRQLVHDNILAHASSSLFRMAMLYKNLAQKTHKSIPLISGWSCASQESEPF